MQLTSVNLLAGLYIAVAVMLIVILYQILFIVVDLRKMMRSWRIVSDQLETIVAKPLSIADQAMDWVKQKLEHGKKHHHE